MALLSINDFKTQSYLFNIKKRLKIEINKAAFNTIA